MLSKVSHNVLLVHITYVYIGAIVNDIINIDTCVQWHFFLDMHENIWPYN